MKFKISRILILVYLFLIPNALKAEGQIGLGEFSDGLLLLIVLLLWFISNKTFNFIYKLVRKENITSRLKKIVLISSLPFAVFCWTLIKFDSEPHKGPIDSIFNPPPPIDWKLFYKEGDTVKLKLKDEKKGYYITRIFIYKNKELQFIRTEE
jgi:hypothetical protein